MLPALWYPPEKMSRWNMEVIRPDTMIGEWAVVDVVQANLEQHHEVVLIDEHGQSIDAWVMFAYPGGNGKSLPISRVIPKGWRDYPKMSGNPQYTLHGYARHTFRSGGESIYVIDLNEENEIVLPSSILVNCSWLNSAEELGIKFLHTGVRVTFQRQRLGVKSLSLENLQYQIDDLRERIKEITAQSD